MTDVGGRTFDTRNSTIVALSAATEGIDVLGNPVPFAM